MAEVVVAQVRVPVEAELTPNQSVEAEHEEVGEEVGARLLARQVGDDVCAGIQVVAVVAAEALDPVTRADLVEGTVGAAIGIGDGNALVSRHQLEDERLDARGDLLGGVVEQRRQREVIDGPATLLADLGDVGAQGPAADERDAVASRGRRAHRRTGR